MSSPSIEWHKKTILVMVGLPARGKSYISKKITTYHNWLGFNAKFFNVGNHRRDVMKATPQTSNFFSSENIDAKAARENIAMEVLDELLRWLAEGGDVAVFDATNTTDARRKTLLTKCKSFSPQLNVIFIESICNDPEVIRKNMMQKATGSPDYKSMPLEDAMADLQNRIGNYEKVYETIDDDSMSYIKLINLQSKIICNRIFESIPQSTATFLMALNVSDRTIWLTRSGQVEGVEDFNGVKLPQPSPELDSIIPGSAGSSEQGFFVHPLKKSVSKVSILTRSQTGFGLSLQGKSDKSLNLSSKGNEFASKLKEFVSERAAKVTDIQIYTSTLPRAVQTAKEIHGNSQQWSALNMLDTGMLNGMSVYEIKKQHPEAFDDFLRDPFHYRLPGGESFEDVVHRTEPFVIELERQTKPCLVIAHLSSLRVLMAYFLGIQPDQLHTIDIPQHTVIQLVPLQYGWKETRHVLDQDT